MRRRKPNVHLVRVLDDAELVAPLDDDAVLAREVDLAPLASATGARVGEGEGRTMMKISWCRNQAPGGMYASFKVRGISLCAHTR